LLEEIRFSASASSPLRLENRIGRRKIASLGSDLLSLRNRTSCPSRIPSRKPRQRFHPSFQFLRWHSGPVRQESRRSATHMYGLSRSQPHYEEGSLSASANLRTSRSSPLRQNLHQAGSPLWLQSRPHRLRRRLENCLPDPLRIL